MVGTAMRGSNLTDGAVPVVLGGGVLAAERTAAHGPDPARLSLLAPRATIELVTEPPVLGAVRWCSSRCGADAALVAPGTT